MVEINCIVFNCANNEQENCTIFNSAYMMTWKIAQYLMVQIMTSKIVQ